MSRSLWFAAGAGVGVYAVVRARRVAEVFTVEGLQDRVGAAVVGLRMFRDDVAQGKAEAETELRERLGLALSSGTDTQELEAPAAGSPSTSPKEVGSS